MSSPVTTTSTPPPTPTTTPSRVLAAFFSTKGELYSAILAGVWLFFGFALHKFADWPRGDILIWASLALGLVHGLRAAGEALLHKKVDIDVLMVVGA
ncbi:MAG: hypothetical protein ACK58T_41380, partial [Phycisphaerae bacterium]